MGFWLQRKTSIILEFPAWLCTLIQSFGARLGYILGVLCILLFNLCICEYSSLGSLCLAPLEVIWDMSSDELDYLTASRHS